MKISIYDFDRTLYGEDNARNYTLYCATEEFSLAEPLYRRSLKIRDNALGSEHPDTQKSHSNLVMLYHVQGSYQASLALEKYSKALFVDAEDIYERINRGRDIVILDLRDKEKQLNKHIPNSIRFPMDDSTSSEEDLLRVLKSTNRGASIVVLAAEDESLTHMVKNVRALGYRTYGLRGGLSYWEESGYPVHYTQLKPEGAV